MKIHEGELSKELERAIWRLLRTEAMYTDLDLKDNNHTKAVITALNNVITQLTRSPTSGPSTS
jgi:hypothetical protein